MPLQDDVLSLPRSQVESRYPDGEGTIDVDTVLWAVGRLPNIKNLNLKSAGVELTEKGYIAVDEYQNTSTEHIYALGDACGRAELTPGKKMTMIWDIEI